MSKPFLIAATATAVASGVGAYLWHEQTRPPILEMYVFALKSGRSMFIRTPDDQRILIDGGGNSQVIQQLTGIIPFYSRRINTIIVTNTDGKNVSGLVDIVGRYLVDKVYVPKFTLENLGIASSTDKIYETFLETVKQKNIKIREVEAEDKLVLGQGIGNLNNSQLSMIAQAKSSSVTSVVAKIIFPAQPESFDYSKASAPELLFNISYGDSSILFMGDASKKVQKFVAESSAIVTSVSPPTIADVDVLIVSHSAVAGNMSPEFMNLVRPESLVYEKVVTNKKTPKNVVVDPLAAILDENRFNLKEVGTIKIVSDGKEVIIKGNN